MHKLYKQTAIIAIAALFTMLLHSCDNDQPNLIGVDIVDKDVFNPKYTDTISLTARSFLYDSINSANLTDEQGNILGAMYDATFGKTTSMLAAAFHLNSTSSERLKFNPVTDSVEVSFAYTSYFGDENYTHTIRVYELEEVLYKDSTRFSNYRVKHSNIEMASITFKPNLDTVAIEDEKVSPSFKMKLDTSFGDKILALPDGALNSNSEFVKNFKGLYLAPDPTNTPNSGSFLKLALDNNQTYINIYYHNDTADNLVFKLIMDKNTPRFMEYEHYEYQHASTEFKSLVLDGNYQNNSKLYVQPLGGVVTEIKMPFLEGFSDVNNLAIADAKIIFNVNETDVLFAIPTSYELVRRGDNGGMVTTADFMEGSSFYGGNIASDGSITFRITRHMQAALTGKYENANLYLHVRNSAYYPGRCVLYGVENENPEHNIKIEITYTSIDY